MTSSSSSLLSTIPRLGKNYLGDFSVNCGLVESACTWNGTGCEFDSWQCQIYIISHVHRAYDYSGPFGVLWVHIAWYKNCVEKVLCPSNRAYIIWTKINCYKNQFFVWSFYKSIFYNASHHLIFCSILFHSRSCNSVKVAYDMHQRVCFDPWTS